MLQKYILSILLASAGATVVFAVTPLDERSAPQAVVRSEKAAKIEHFVSDTDVTYQVIAEPWSLESAKRLKSATRGNGSIRDTQKPQQIGYPRAIASGAQSLPLTSLAWTSLVDGSRAARVTVLASDAAGMRIGYRVEGPATGLELRVAGSGRDEVYPSDATPGQGIIWSPVLEGDTATLELRLMQGIDAAQFSVRLEGISHLVMVGAALGRKDSRDIGTAGSCNIDVACVANPSQALLDASKAVAKMVFTDAGTTYSCSGTLLNSSPFTGVPYFYTAAHCIDNQSAASTLNTYWFFDAVSCNSFAIPPYQLITGGAALLVTDTNLDGTLLRLNQSPPSGAVLSAWNASVVATGQTVVAIHHPQGDLKKFSQGSLVGYVKQPVQLCSGSSYTLDPTESYANVRWSEGTTEQGSSGSGLLTYNASNGSYELRGGLEGGAAGCDCRNGVDQFSRLDLMFTKVAPWLQPSAVIPVSNASVASMVEYFNPQFDYYFMSPRETDKVALDTIVDSFGNHTWYRTGYWFKTDTAASASTASISRYFIPGAAKGGTRGSHFYTVLNSDKAAISGTGKERFSPCDGIPNGYFCNEGIQSFVAPPFGTGASAECLSSGQKIYRVFRGAPRFVDDGNHRYLTNLAMYQYMVNDQGWSGEFVNFCAKP